MLQDCFSQMLGGKDGVPNVYGVVWEQYTVTSFSVMNATSGSFNVANSARIGSSSQKIWLSQTQHSHFFDFVWSPVILFSYSVNILSLFCYAVIFFLSFFYTDSFSILSLVDTFDHLELLQHWQFQHSQFAGCFCDLLLEYLQTSRGQAQMKYQKVCSFTLSRLHLLFSSPVFLVAIHSLCSWENTPPTWTAIMQPSRNTVRGKVAVKVFLDCFASGAGFYFTIFCLSWTLHKTLHKI